MDIGLKADEAGTSLSPPVSDILSIVNGKLELDLTTPATVAGVYDIFVRAKPIENAAATYVYRPFKLTLLAPRDAACDDGSITHAAATPSKC